MQAVTTLSLGLLLLQRILSFYYMSLLNIEERMASLHFHDSQAVELFPALTLAVHIKKNPAGEIVPLNWFDIGVQIQFNFVSICLVLAFTNIISSIRIM